MAYRQIQGLISADWCEKPSFIGKARPKGVKAQGLRYEKKVAKAIPGAMHSRWIVYLDQNGRGFANPDLILPLPGCILVLECKLTDTNEAQGQLSDLYLPLLRLMLPGQAIYGLIVAKYLTPGSKMIVESLSDGVKVVQASGRIPILHWPGRNSAVLVPPSLDPAPQGQNRACPPRAGAVA